MYIKCLAYKKCPVSVIAVIVILAVIITANHGLERRLWVRKGKGSGGACHTGGSEVGVRQGGGELSCDCGGGSRGRGQEGTLCKMLRVRWMESRPERREYS